MAYKFKDLIVTVVPEADLEIFADTATVGSCTSEGCVCKPPKIEEIFNRGGPLSYLSSEVQNDLRQLLSYSLAKSNIKTEDQKSIKDLEEKMKPTDIKQVEKLEKELTSILNELKHHKEKLKK